MKEYDALEQAMDMLISEAAKELCEESDYNEEQGAVHFSKEHREKMNKLFEKELKENKPTYIITFLKRSKSVVWVVLVCLLILLTSTDIAKNWIERTINFLFQSDKPNSVYNTNDGYMTIDFGDGVDVEYIPSGFRMVEWRKTKQWHAYTFENKDGDYFQMIIGNDHMRGRIDSENADATDVYINGVMGKCVRGGKDISITWEIGEYYLNVIGNISEEEIIKICRNIKNKINLK